MKNEVIVALDFNDKKSTLDFLKDFKEPIFVKIGMQLFYKEGRSIVEEIKTLGHKIFLDLKLHDIPNTVNKAIESLNDLDVDIITIHTQGGIEMMKKAVEIKNPKTIIVGVTYLTSLNQNIFNDEGFGTLDFEKQLLQLAKNAKEANLNGVVCSVHESAKIKNELGNEFITIVPGIRVNQSAGDQKRVATPKEAKEQLATHIVVGREITLSNTPYETYKEIVKEFSNE